MSVEDEEPPKFFDSRSLSCRSLSPPTSSIEVKSPLITIVPPSPLPSAPLLPEQKAHFIDDKKSTLGLPIKEISKQISILISAIYDYDSLISESRHRTLSDLNAILRLVPEATLVHTKLETLASQINTLYREQHSSTQHLRLLCDDLPITWTAFLGLDDEEKRRVARTQGRDSSLMRIFGMLGEVRKGCLVQETFDAMVEKKAAVLFEEILGELKRVGPEEAAMKWRVLGIVMGKRKALLAGSVEEILGARLRVSGTLVGFVEVLREVGEADEEQGGL
jgi:hypothetical protein